MRPIAAAILAAGAAALGLAGPAEAGRLVTWTTKSRYVDPAKVEFNGPPRPKALRVNVWLPDGYDGRRRFPVLFLLHGHGDAYDSWARPDKGDLRAVARRVPAVVVMPEGDRGWYVDWWNGGKRGAPAWERYHLDELIPLVERRLRIRRGRRWHAIAGLSMGGEGAIFYASQRPGYFGSAASFSGVLSTQRPEWPGLFDTQGERHVEVFGEPRAQRFYWSGHNPSALARNLRATRVFVAVGDGVPQTVEDRRNSLGAAAEALLRRQAVDFVAAARRARVDLTYRPQRGIHDWPYWRAHLAQAIDWGLFRPVPSAPRSWTYRTVSRRGRAWGLRFSFKRPPTSVQALARRGRTIRGRGRGAVTIRIRGKCGLTARLPFRRRLSRPCAGHLRPGLLG